jgi:hypothetical protein
VIWPFQPTSAKSRDAVSLINAAILGCEVGERKRRHGTHRKLVYIVEYPVTVRSWGSWREGVRKEVGEEGEGGGLREPILPDSVNDGKTTYMYSPYWLNREHCQRFFLFSFSFAVLGKKPK